MKKNWTIQDLENFLRNEKRTQFIGITTETSGKNSFNATENGTGKKVDRMSVKLGYAPTDIIKYSRKVVIVTPLSFKGLVENRNEKDVREVLEVLQLTTEDVEKQLAYAEMLKAQSEKEYDVAKRRNGTSVTGMIALSAKDQHPMITVYNNARNRPQTDFYLKDGTLLDKAILKPYKKPYSFEKKYKKQLEFGIVNPIDTQNYRLENVRGIRQGGDDIDIVPVPA